MTARFVAVCVTLVALFVARVASAAPQLRTVVTPDTIQVGESATVSLVVSPGDQVTRAEIHAMPAGLDLVGQSVSPSFQITVVNGQMSQVVTARAMFRIRASRVGTYIVGPPSVVSGGARYVGDRVTLKVVPTGTIQRRVDPFDPFNMLGPNGPFQQLQPLDQMPDDLLQPSVTIDPKYNLDRPRDTGPFLHATVDKTSAVVGEQVTLSIYAYVETEFDPSDDWHEVGTPDFLQRSLRPDNSRLERLAYARAGNRTYAVFLLRRYALFPLHTGELGITPMRVGMRRGGERTTEPITIHVTEPPIDHRPAGYVVGDTGHFTVSADVAPRTVPRGAAIAVTVELSGSGNLPTSLIVPVRPGVTWLDPEVKDDLHVLDAQTAGPDVWGGTRRFSYIVTPTNEGDLDLGDITAPFYDPKEHAYGVARATLGVVHVTPGTTPTATDGQKALPNMPMLRAQMGSTRGAEAHLDDTNTFWGLLAMPTALFAIAISGRRAARRIAERARERKASPLSDLKQRLRALDAATAGDDARAVDGATIRALESGAAAHAGVNVRGVGGEEVASVLTRAGVASETAGQLRDLLDACAAARFSPDGAALADARKRAERARAVIERLGNAPVSADGRPSEA